MEWNMNVTKRFLDSTAELWDAYLDHPFVKGIADGSLDEEKFRYYMVQDYLYLIEYARVFALGVAKAKDLSSMRLFAAYVKQIMDEVTYRRHDGKNILRMMKVVKSENQK